MKATSKAVKEKIYKNAASLMQRSGVKGWNMNDLAESSGITKMTLYKIIASKENLIREVAFSSIGAMRETILEITRKDSPFADRMENLVAALPEILRNNYINNYSSILNEFPELEADIVKENEKLYSEISSFYEEGINSGMIKKEVTPDLLHHMVQAFVIYFSKYTPLEGDPGSRMKSALTFLINGIMAGNTGSDL